MIKIHDSEVKFIKKKMEEAIKKDIPVLAMHMDLVQIATILGLIEKYEAMTAGKEYQEGYAKGFYDAKDIAKIQIGRMEINAG